MRNRFVMIAALLLSVICVGCSSTYQTSELHNEVLPSGLDVVSEEEDSSIDVKETIEEQSSQDEETQIVLEEDADSSYLPDSYDYRELGKMPTPKNQEEESVCWAAASLTAIESSLLPEENLTFSMEHMAKGNSFGREVAEGGNYLQAVAYLVAWQGPVLESAVKQCQNIFDDSLTAAKHVQEVQILPQKDYESIKQYIFQYGGVHSCIYLPGDVMEKSNYYNWETSSYCYIGEETVNHDVAIIGWDDAYPRENFSTPVQEDGAFLCLNSWGSEFGENGCFWVSYEDSCIGIYNIAYTKIESVDNYDHIYQSDLCGWLGTLGFDVESSYMANVYTAREDEMLEAVGFYATGENTKYEVYAVSDFVDTNSLKTEQVLAEGVLEKEGYYTVPLEQGVELKTEQKFAVIVHITTPNSPRPIAIEYATGEYDSSRNVDISDGEGYVSHLGRYWNRAEAKNWQCNICLKAYTNGKDGT